MTRKRGDCAEHSLSALGQQHLLLQRGKPPILLSGTKPALPQSQGGFPGVNSPGGARAFSAQITPSSFLISPAGLDAFLIQAFPSCLRLLKWSNAA